MKICINTLGEFDIMSNGQSILQQSSRTYKLFKLFVYFLTFRNKKLSPENIIDSLLSDNESGDPKNMLRTQIFRLRRVLKSLLPEGEDESKYMSINFTNGYYCLEVGENICIDVDEFESLIKQADVEYDYNIEISVELYRKALKCYNGLYLFNNAYEVWLVPTRNYYHRLYLKTLYKLIDILKENNENDQVITLCEESLLVEPYEENIHINLMEAMLKQGQQKSALNHYEYSSELLEKELDSKPSSDFIGLLNKIQNYSTRKTDVNLVSIQDDLDENNLLGAMQCTPESFKFLFNLQKRKSIRNSENDYLCIVNLNKNKMKNSRDLSELFRNSLRKGDVFTFWSQNQVLILLHNAKRSGPDVIEQRIMNNINTYTKLTRNDFKMVFQQVLSEKTKI